MLGLIPQTESTPPLYYCVAWVWARVFGYSETGLRSLSAVCGVVLVPVVYAGGAKLISRRAGVIAAAFAACSPLLIWYSQEARSYEMLALLSGLSLLAFAYARADPTPRALAFWVVASALALATHYYAVLAVVPEAVWLLWIHRTRRPVQIAFAVVGLCGLGLIPLAISQHGTGRGNWISNAPFWRRLGQIVPQFSSGFEGPAHGRVRAAGDRDRGSVVGSAPDAVVGRGAARGAARRWARAGRVRAQPDPGRGWLRRPADAQHAGDLDGLRAARRRRVGRAAPARCPASSPPPCCASWV